MVKEYDTNSGIIAWFARNTVAANLLMFAIIIAGIISTVVIRKQIFPDFVTNAITVRVAYPGAAPQEVEEGIVVKIEENIKEIEGIEKISSFASEGSANITVEVKQGYEVSEVMDEVKIRVDSIPRFPDSAERPIIYERRFTRDVMWVSVYGDADERTLKELANEIQNELVEEDAISNVEVNGVRPYEVSIQVTDQKLREYGLTLEQVANAVRTSSLDLPSGTIKTAGGDILVRTKEQAYKGYEFAQIPLLTRTDGTRLFLSDVAAIDDGFAEYEYISRFDGKNAVNLRVKSSLESDDLASSEAVYKYLDKKSQALPPSVSLDAWGDGTYYLKGRLNLMLGNLFAGLILVFLVLALFLRFRLSFWVAVGIPICFAGAMLSMLIYPGFAITINMITLFAFILVLGIVVDDAIIIAESSWSSIEEKGHSVDSVIQGARRVALPATFGVLTTIAAFYPMLNVSGAFSNAMASIGLVVMFCLLFSLVESKLILPAHLAHMKLVNPEDSKNPTVRKTKMFFTGIRRKFASGLKRFITNVYAPKLKSALEVRGLVIVSFICLFLISTAGFIGSGWVKAEMFPNIPNDGVFVEIKMAEGATAESTIGATETVAAKLEELDKEVTAEYGKPIKAHYVMWTNNNTAGYLWVELQKSENMPINQFKVTDLWRDKVGQIPGVKEIGFGGGGGPGGGGVGYRLIGDNMDELRTVSEALKDKLATYEGVYDISDSLSGGKEEIVIKLKPEATNLGLTVSDLSRQVRNAFYGAEAQRFQRDNEEIKVFVRYPLSERRSLGNLENMPVRTNSGDYVTFADIATFELADGFSTISRIDGVRANRLSADVSPEAPISSNDIDAEIKRDFLPDLLAKHPSVELVPGGPSKNAQTLQFELVTGFLIGMGMIFILLALPLKSYIKPLVVMSAIPFGIIGAMIGHLIMGISLSLFSFFGIIALSGVVVNDSLLMVDFINRARAEGMSRKEAALNAGTRRFRAIILTSLTTFFGLLPITLETSLQAQMVIPMAVSLGFGIVFATLITLVWIPCLYVMMGNAKDWFLNRDPKSLAKQAAMENA